MGGAVAIEFALLIIPLLLIVAGIVEFGRMFWYYDAMSKGTRDAARYLSNARATGPEALDGLILNRAIDLVVDSANAANVPAFTAAQVSVICDPACGAPDYIRVSVEYPLELGAWIPFFSSASQVAIWDISLTPETTMRYMH